MDTIRAILDSDNKHMQKVALIVKKILSDDKLVTPLFELLETGSKVERGTAAEVMKFVSKEKAELIAPYIDTLIEYIDYDVPRVMWGCPESIGNLAKNYPKEVEKAIPKLLKNLENDSTVIRWCAAFALGEIAKYNKDKQSDLLEKFDKIIKKEKNNGVKNVFKKAIKFIKKNLL